LEALTDRALEPFFVGDEEGVDDEDGILFDEPAAGDNDCFFDGDVDDFLALVVLRANTFALLLLLELTALDGDDKEKCFSNNDSASSSRSSWICVCCCGRISMLGSVWSCMR